MCQNKADELAVLIDFVMEFALPLAGAKTLSGAQYSGSSVLELFPKYSGHKSNLCGCGTVY